jgi:hypothetical protein
MASRHYSEPIDWLEHGGAWPQGPFKQDAPVYAVKTAGVVARLEAAIKADGRSARQIALAAGMNPGTLSRLRAGTAVPDLGTIHSLEIVLDTDLWGGRS